MQWTWPCWRLITEDKASFTEVTTIMSIIDVMQLYEALTVMHEARHKADKK